MKIVIDIDNESYEHIKAYQNEDVLPMGWYAISHGTPLTPDVPDINDGNINCVLDKIRAEIENDWQLKKYPSSPFSCGLRRALEIIEKYKAALIKPDWRW